jgi:hypothetical protein
MTPYNSAMIGSVGFSGRGLRIDSLQVELEHPIAEAFALDNLVVVRFPYDASPRGYGAFDNLLTLNSRGERAWVAELPTNGTDSYVAISSREPLVANSWSGFQCTLDPESGKILRKVFTK